MNVNSVMNVNNVLTVIIVISLILRQQHQPLDTEPWNLNQWLKNQQWQITLSLLLLLLVRSIPSLKLILS